MNWDSTTLRGQRTGIDWAGGGNLDKIDPYLVWFDLSDFAGAQLRDGNGVQCLVELPNGDDLPPTHRVETTRFDQIAGLLDRLRAGAIDRFELSTPTFVGGGPGQSITAVADPLRLSGKPQRGPTCQATLVAFIDYGCAFAHRQFRQWQGGQSTLRTRVIALWDQGASAAPAQGEGPSLAWQCPADFGYGLETLRDAAPDEYGLPPVAGLRLDDYIAQFRRADGSIDEARCYAQSGYHAATRPTTHGTHMMDVATGYPSPLTGLPGEEGHEDQPHSADIVFVQLPRWIRGRQVGGMLRTHVLDAMRYILSLAAPDTRVVVNLSYGTYAGPHDGSSMLEEAIGQMIAEGENKTGPRLDVVVAAGNAYDKALHALATITSHTRATFIWHNPPDDPSDSFVELWLPAAPVNLKVRVLPPGMPDAAALWLQPGQAAALRQDGHVLASLVVAHRTCQGRNQRMVLLAVAPTVAGTPRRSAPYGAWRIEVYNDCAEAVDVHAWCERDDLGYGGEPWPRQGYFSKHATSAVRADSTLSSLAHGLDTRVAGAFVRDGPVADYSSTGPALHDTQGLAPRRQRPDVLAPSEENPALPGLAAAAMVGTETVRLNGTSVAAAYVTRLMLEGRYPGPPPAKGKPVRPAEPPLSAHPDESDVPRVP